MYAEEFCSIQSKFYVHVSNRQLMPGYPVDQWGLRWFAWTSGSCPVIIIWFDLLQREFSNMCLLLQSYREKTYWLIGYAYVSDVFYVCMILICMYTHMTLLYVFHTTCVHLPCRPHRISKVRIWISSRVDKWMGVKNWAGCRFSFGGWKSCCWWWRWCWKGRMKKTPTP